MLIIPLSQVTPAAVFADVARDAGARIAVFNIERTSRDNKADFLFLGPCEVTLLKAFGLDSLTINEDLALLSQEDEVKS